MHIIPQIIPLIRFNSIPNIGPSKFHTNSNPIYFNLPHIFLFSISTLIFLFYIFSFLCFSSPSFPFSVFSLSSSSLSFSFSFFLYSARPTQAKPAPVLPCADPSPCSRPARADPRTPHTRTCAHEDERRTNAWTTPPASRFCNSFVPQLEG